LQEDLRAVNAEMKVDEATCRRVGALAAYAVGEKQIQDALLLTDEMMEQVKASPVYLQALAEKSLERAEHSIAVSEGWDGVEQLGIGKVLKALEYNVDPAFALQAAAIANRAKRATTPHKTINAVNTGRVVILSMNRKFVDGRQVSEDRAVMTVEGRDMKSVPRRQADLPSPRKVTDMLQISKQRSAVEALVREETAMEMDELAGKYGIADELFDE
jgi:hypothetical protein